MTFQGDFLARTRVAWDAKRDGYFLDTQWHASGETAHAHDERQVFFKNLVQPDGRMIFLGNYNQVLTTARVRASRVAHEQLNLVRGLSTADRKFLRRHPGKKMTVQEIREARRSLPDPSSSVGDRRPCEVDHHGEDDGDIVLVAITRSKVVNELTNAVMKRYIGQQGHDRMSEALSAFLTTTPNGGSTRLFLELENLRADTIEIVPHGQPNRVECYDISLTCSPIDTA